MRHKPHAIPQLCLWMLWKRYKFMRFLVLFFAVISSACGKAPLVQTQSYVFGTLVDISIYGETEAKAQTAANQIMQQFQTLHQRLHAWQASELSTINKSFAKGRTPVAIAPDIANLITDATQLSGKSSATFNGTLHTS